MNQRPPISTLFPYTTLFRSIEAHALAAVDQDLACRIHDRHRCEPKRIRDHRDRKSTRLNSSHTVISYAVFCLKKKKIRSNDLELRTVTLSTAIRSIPKTRVL